MVSHSQPTISMGNLLSAFSAFLFFIGAIYWRIMRGTTYSGSVPRVGPSGVIGYIITALRFTLDAEPIIEGGKTQFAKSPFTIPTLSGPVFWLGPEHLEAVRSSTDDMFNSGMAVGDDLQLAYTLDDQQTTNPYHANILRTNVNRAISSYIPDILDESILAIQETFDANDDASHPVFDLMTHLVARISNRVIFGLELCRDDEFLHSIVNFAEEVLPIAAFLRWSPLAIRGALYLVLSNVFFKGKKTALKIMVPFLTQRIQDGMTKSDEAMTVADLMIKGAPENETVEALSIRLLNVNFGSIHTSSIFITQTLFEMALLSKQDLESIREEIREALNSEGGWTKNALLKFKKVDSALREVGRYYGMAFFALPRLALGDYDLGKGQMVPAGQRVVIDIKSIHFDPEIYPEPDRCDLFRFSRLRDTDGNDSKYGFATVDKHYLPFGAGRHACAGRFFAAMVVKIMLAHILLNYDFSFPPGVSGRPQNITFNGAIIPDSKACLVFKRRSASIA